MDRGEYTAQIEDIILDLIGRHGQATRTLILHTFLGSLPPAACDFDTLARSETAGGFVRDALRRRTVTATDTAMPTLFGYERLHTEYSVVRDGERTIVPVHQCTDQELLSKVTEMDGMIDGLTTHKREIRAFIADRGQKS